MDLLVAKKYRLAQKIGGEVQEVYAGTDIQTGEEVSIKIESLNCRSPQLHREVKVYRELAGGCKTVKFQ